jgi:fatty-acyl-CoA synthase
MAEVVRDWVAFNARRLGAKPALVGLDSGYRATWPQLEDRVGRLADVIDRAGVRAGDRVMVIADNDPRVFEVQFACIRVGAIFTPLNWRLSYPELRALCDDAAPAMMIHDAMWADTATKLAADCSIRSTRGWGGSDGSPSFDGAVDAATYRPPWRHALDTDTCMILYTSGTTGLPKGVRYTNRMLLWQAFNTVQVNALAAPGASHLTATPLFHAGGLNAVANSLLYFGGSVSITKRFEAERMLGLMGDPANGYTHIHCVPTMWQMLFELPAFEGSDFSSFRHAHAGGGVLPRPLFEAFRDRGLVIQHHYGGSEMGPAVTTMPKADADRKHGSCGFPVPHTQIRVVDEQGNDVEGNQPGEVWLKGPSITPGYWNVDNDTSGSFVDGWFKTGDVLWVDDEGFFYFADRRKDMYKSGGENVFCAEVERVLAGTPGVAEVIVIGVPDTRWGEVGRAVVVPQPGQTVTLEQLRQQCEGVIARYKAPKSLVVLDDLPRNATGKVNKHELRARYGAPEGP